MSGATKGVRRAPGGAWPRCEHCENDAACVGVYEDPTGPLAFACHDCCGHGCEDGWCIPLAEEFPE